MKIERIVNAWYRIFMALHLTYKSIGETPLQALERLRIEKNIPESESMTYAGRLDPAAQGVLLVLSGGDVHRKEEFLNLEKKYDFQVLFGISTDSLDLLGMVNSDIIATQNILVQLVGKLDSFVGAFNWQYPKFSSKTVNGVPLFEHTKKGSEIEIPSRLMTIKDLSLCESKIIPLGDLQNRIYTVINSVSGDFRQELIVNRWREIISQNKEKELCLVSFSVTVGSGTYIRVLAEKMGESLGVPALAFSITRTAIGSMSI